uniref:Spc7 kinetochore protein domain-containing protein n=1 Tax=Globisporangium ultimum (strain ATCC 200006 / CBS 805.95 / DAOM BR144) TaxID=431595 RepID=K3X8C1_GLOUD
MASEGAGDGAASPPLAPPPPPPPLSLAAGGLEQLATHRSESIASQFQREIILGELAQTRHLRIDGATGGGTMAAYEGSRDDIEIDTPETFATKSAAVAAAAAAAAANENDETSRTERTATQVAQAIEDAADEAETEDENDYDTQDEQSAKATETTTTTTDDADIRGTSTPKATTTAARFVSPPRITRRTTLSPAKASLLLNENQNSSSGVIDDGAISRRDTVSPAALKSLLQSISLDDKSPSSQQKWLLAAKAAAGSTVESESESESKTQDERTMSSATNQFLASLSTTLQTPESVRKTRAMKRREREERTLSPSEVLSMTMSEMITSENGSKNSTSAGKSKRKRKSTSSSSSPAAGLDGNSSVSSSSDSFTDTFFSSKLVVAVDNSGDVENSGNETEPLQEEEDEVSDTPRKKGRSDDDSTMQMSNSKSRRTTLEPTDAADFLSELRQEMQPGSKHTNATLPPSIEEEEDEKEEGSSEAEPANRRQSLAAVAGSNLDPSPMTRSKSRRATVDPSDIFAIVNGTSEHSSSSSNNNSNNEETQSTTRRETLNAEDLYEINPELASRRKRKQQHDSDEEQKGSPDRQDGKKARANDDEPSTESPPPDAIVSTMSKSKTGLSRPQKTPTPRKRQQRDEEQPSATRHSARLQERETTISAEFASPSAPGDTRMRTPLKSILSARKPPKGNGQLMTPTKSVNFGPPEGAEFNLGSPSTSMTPMLAKDARRMFPLDRITTPPSPVEEDDEETSLNTSLLDEADAIDSDDDGEQKEGFEGVLEVSNSRLNLLVSKSAEKNRRRFSLRGVSPLDNQANARRQRRNSMSASVMRTSPVSARKLKGIGPGALANLPAPPPSATKSSFLSSEDAQPQGRLAYADSSASSDAGEDMEITGDFSNFVQAGGVLSKSNSATSRDQSGAAAQLGSQPSFRLQRQDAEESKDDSLFADSPLHEETVELGSLGDLVAESAAYDTTYQRRTQRPTTQNSSDEEEEAEAPTLGSLSDLAHEDEEQSVSSRRPGSSSANLQFSSSTVRRFNSLHYNNLDEQDVTLDPIMEEEEDAGNSSAPSMMSIASSDEESDSDTYDARRKSLVVNLSSKFERIGSGTPKAKKQQQANAEVTASVLKARITSPLRRSPRRKSQAPAVPLISMDELLATIDLQSISDDQTTPDDRFEELYTKHTTADPAIEPVKLATVADACEDVVKSHIDEISSWSTGLSDVLGSLLSEKAPALFSPQSLDEAGIASIKALHELETVRVQSGWCQWRAKMEREMVEKLQLSVAELENDVDTLKSMVAKDTATKQSELAALQELIEREKQMAELLDAIEEQQSVRNEYAVTVDVLETHCASLSLEASVLHDQLRVVEGVASEGNHISAETSFELERQVLDAEELAAIQGSLSVWRIAVATSSHLKLSAQFDDVVVRVDLQVDVMLHAPPSSNGSSRGGGFSTDVSSRATLKRRRRSQQYLESDKDIVHLVQQKLFDPVQLSRFVRTASSTASDEDLLDQDRPGRVSPDEIRVEIEKEEATQNEYEYITRVCERLRNTFVVR